MLPWLYFQAWTALHTNGRAPIASYYSIQSSQQQTLKLLKTKDLDLELLIHYEFVEMTISIAGRMKQWLVLIQAGFDIASSALLLP